MAQKTRITRRIDLPAQTTGGGGTLITTAQDTATPTLPDLPTPRDLSVSAGPLLRSAVTPKALIAVTYEPPDAAVPPESYSVQYAKDSGFTNPITVSVFGLSASLTADCATLYYVRVAAVFRNMVSEWTDAASDTTTSDTTAPAVPTSVSASFTSHGDLVIQWANPTSANFRDVEIAIYESASKSTQYYIAYSSDTRYVFSATLNLQQTSGAGDPSLYVELRSRSWSEVYSSAVNASATLAAPSAPSGLTTSWAGDTGTAGPDCTITWTLAADLSYRLTIDGGTARTLSNVSRYTYTLDANRADHGGAPDPVLSLSLVAVDGLGQASTAATATATNAAPAAPTVTLTDAFGFILARVTSSPPADFAASEYVWKLGGVTQLTQESTSSEQQYEAAASGTWTVAVRVKDTFGQYSSATTSASVVHDPLTIGTLRAGAVYSDDLGTLSTTLAALKDGTTASGGVSYGAIAPTLRGAQTANDTAVTQLTISVPSGTTTGDGMILAIGVRGGSGVNVSTPTGWTLVLTQNQSTGVRLALFSRVAASEPASYTVSWTGGSFDAAGGIYAAQNVDALSLVEASNSQGNASSTAVVAPTVTTTSANTLLLFIGAAQSGPTWTAPGGETERWDVQSSGGSKISLTLAEETLTSAGATGTRTATLSGAQQSVGALVALRGAWHWTVQEEPFIARRRNITLAATAGEGYLGISSDGTTYTWYAGPLGVDGRTLTAVASETAARLAPAALPSNGRWDLPVMVDARYNKLGHRATSSASYTLREDYARRLIQADDLEAESVIAIAIQAGTITADKLTVTQLSAIAADLGTITAGTITGATIQTATSGARTVLSSAANGGLIGYSSSDTYNPSTGSGTYQILWKKTDGKLYAGAGNARLDQNGLALAGTGEMVAWYSSAFASKIGRLIGFDTTGLGGLVMEGYGTATNPLGYVEIAAHSNDNSQISKLSLRGNQSGSTAFANFFASGTFLGLRVGDGSTPTAMLDVQGTIVATDSISPAIDDSGTTNTPTGLLLRHTTSGTPAAGFGIATKYQLESDTTTNRDAAQVNVVWGTATDASRKGQMQFYAYDNAGARAFLVGSANGTAATIGFLGAAAVAQQSIGAAAPAGGTGTAAGGWDTAAHRDAAITLLNNIRTALNNLGLTV